MTDPDATERLVLDAGERRVLGTLIEKGLTHPQSYPLSLSALANGCNQKSNRDPITRFEEIEVQEICERLRERGLVTRFMPGEGGRVERYRQELGRNYELRGVELAVIGELFLRGAQSEGELRQRASRMRDIPSLDALREILDKLAAHKPPFVVRLSPEGAQRGVRYTHACYDDDEMAAVLEAERSGAARAVSAAPRSPRANPGEVEALKARVDELEARVRRLEEALGGGD